MSSTNNEINDLFDYGYKIIQNKDYFKFSIDSVLLAEAVDIKKGQTKILDLCTGNAPVPLIMSTKFNNLTFTGVELQKEIYDMGVESVKLNNVDNITLLNEDVKNIPNLLDNHSFDIVTCNPPYFIAYDERMINDNDIKAIARHEIKVNLEDIIKISSKMVKNQGYLYLVHRAERLADIVDNLHKYNFGLKRIIPIYNDNHSNSCFILIEAIYNGKDYVIINKPVFLNEYKSYKNIFGGNL